jgi:hypothetical protein
LHLRHTHGSEEAVEETPKLSRRRIVSYTDMVFGAPLETLRMPPQCLPRIAACRHLYFDHWLDRDEVERAVDGVLIRLHFEQHGLPADTRVDPSCLPWQIASVAHELSGSVDAS